MFAEDLKFLRELVTIVQLTILQGDKACALARAPLLYTGAIRTLTCQ